jgi:hypothetical protein
VVVTVTVSVALTNTFLCLKAAPAVLERVRVVASAARVARAARAVQAAPRKSRSLNVGVTATANHRVHRVHPVPLAAKEAREVAKEAVRVVAREAKEAKEALVNPHPMAKRLAASMKRSVKGRKAVASTNAFRIVTTKHGDYGILMCVCIGFFCILHGLP